MAVCEFCRTTVLKDVGATEHLGKLSEVLEDYSPIQIGTGGQADGRAFTVIGRIQLRYAHGIWNEWYLWFDDGASGWLGDASGQYTLTLAREISAAVPAFDDVTPGKLYTIDGERYTAADRRVARCIGGQGELPFKVGDGWEARVADLRGGKRFVTLDYSEQQPRLYSGSAVTLAGMKCQLLRDDEQIKAGAGRYRGKLGALDCPSCGSAIKYVPGATAHLICPSCAARLDASGPEAQVLAAGERIERAQLSLELGASATIDASTYSVIGAMIRVDDEGTRWFEYLLFSARAGMFWLINADGEWYRSTVLDEWPAWHANAEQATLGPVVYHKSTEYPARVEFAAGAFNWRVQAGDTVRVFEFEHADRTLAAELTSDELTWSRSTPVAHAQVSAWFGKSLRGMPATPKTQSKPAASRNSTPTKFMWWVIGLNFVPLMFNFFQTAIILVIAIIALFYPPAGFKNDDSESA